MTDETKQASRDSTPDAGVAVDDLVRQLSIEAETGMRRATNDAEHAKKQLDDAQSRIVYWRGRADTLSELLARAARPQTGPAHGAAQESTTSASSAESAEAADLLT